MEVLWPEEDPDRLAHRLSVALATLRKVLDPGRGFESDHFVGGDGETLWLDSANVTVDVERFVAEARTGLALLREGRVPEAIDSLEAAESLYAGDFLEEDLYEDWATPLREKSRALYISLAHSLAEHAAQGGDHDAAVRYLLRLLERDPFDEEAHLLLVATLDRAGRHGEARRRYRAYAARMEEIDVEAAPFLARYRGFRSAL